jgi:hypothetical protein
MSLDGYLYDRQGRPITWEQYAEMGVEDRILVHTERDGVLVSTVWLGMDMGYAGGEPLIFETMIFGGEHDQYQWRWSTEVEARAAHEVICTAEFGEPVESLSGAAAIARYEQNRVNKESDEHSDDRGTGQAQPGGRQGTREDDQAGGVAVQEGREHPPDR